LRRLDQTLAQHPKAFTNALVALGDPSHPVFVALEKEITEGSVCSTNSVAWHEFVRGPLKDTDHHRALWILENRIHALDKEDAEIAALLFNRGGRKRASTSDCLIAASALRRELQLVTLNLSDFEPFVAYGLKLYPLPRLS
jgi:predicted nucleic acid-binding protein